MLAGIIVLVVYNINSLVKVFTLLLISFYRYTRVYKFIWLPRDNADITKLATVENLHTNQVQLKNNEVLTAKT